MPVHIQYFTTFESVNCSYLTGFLAGIAGIVGGGGGCKISLAVGIPFFFCDTAAAAANSLRCRLRANFQFNRNCRSVSLTSLPS